MLRHRYGSPTAFAVSCLGKEKNKIVKIFGLSLSMSINAKKQFTRKKFYKNKVDTFKLTFDSKFNDLTEEELIKLEMSRQIDKSVNNAIGAFHEEILGGIRGF